MGHPEARKAEGSHLEDSNMYESVTLNNGIKCVGRNTPNRDSLSIGVWINTGGRYEKKEENGISHFLEHLLFKGTLKRSAEDIKRAIEGRGGAMNGFTSEEFTCYLVKVLGRDRATALDVLSDMVINPRLLPNDVERERTVIIEEIKMYMDLPTHYVYDLLIEMLWPNQPLGRNLAGTIESVNAITRNDIAGYKKRYYNPNNIVVAACGDLDCRAFFKDCERSLKSVSAGLRSTFKKAAQDQRYSRLRVLFKQTEQTHLAMGMRAFGRDDPDKYALNLLNIILGGNMSSRLFRELREKRGLVYEISAHTKKFRDTGIFSISAGLDTKNILKALSLIVNELNLIRRKEVGRSEFERAREFYRGQLLLGLEDTTEHMLWMGEHMTADGGIPTPKEVLSRIDKLAPRDIIRAANRIFKDSSLNLALIGPVKKTNEKGISEVLTLK
ncbi:MAG: pitrilysin family protein [Candidatus Omnitrophota bacterium]